MVWIRRLVISVNIDSLRYAPLIDGTSGGASAIASEFPGYLSSTVGNQSLVANFFAYFKPAQHLKSHDILFLVCCPAHLREMVKQEHEREGVNPCHGSSNIRMIPERDKAFVLVSGGICPAEELEDFYLRLVLHSNIIQKRRKKFYLYVPFVINETSRSWIILIECAVPMLFQGELSLFLFFVFWFQAIL